MDEVVCVYIYYSAIRENEILPFVIIWMDLEGFMLNELNQTDKYYMILPIKFQNKLKKNRLVVVSGMG